MVSRLASPRTESSYGVDAGSDDDDDDLGAHPTRQLDLSLTYRHAHVGRIPVACREQRADANWPHESRREWDGRTRRRLARPAEGKIRARRAEFDAKASAGVYHPEGARV